MRTLLLASVALILVAGPATASTVSLVAALGGNPNGAGCVSPKVLFTPGSESDNQTFDEAQTITWDVKIVAGGGDHRGVANFVFDVELHEGTESGPLVSSAVYHSVTNNGSCGSGATAAFAANAAFAYSFQIASYGPGRVTDLITAGGPLMSVHCYPNNPGDGVLYGMGAGHSAWKRGAQATFTCGGVGLPKPPACAAPSCGDPNFGGLGYGPVAQGQISGLTPGTYVLKIVPGAGTNVLKPTLTSADATAFANATTTVTGDTITFEVTGGCQPTALATGWDSVMLHGGDGDLSIALNPAARNVEPRRVVVGDSWRIVVDLDSDISSGYTAGNVSITPSLNYTDTLINGGTTLVIEIDEEITLPVLATMYTIDISGASTCLDPAGDLDCDVSYCIGNVNLDNSITLGDMAFVKSKALVNAPVPSNVEFDINHDGGNITLGDVALTKSIATGPITNCP